MRKFSNNCVTSKTSQMSRISFTSERLSSNTNAIDILCGELMRLRNKNTIKTMTNIKNFCYSCGIILCLNINCKIEYRISGSKLDFRPMTQRRISGERDTQDCSILCSSVGTKSVGQFFNGQSIRRHLISSVLLVFSLR